MDLSPIIAELSEKHGLTKAHINTIIHSQFATIKHIMYSGQRDNVFVRHLGKFAVKKGRHLIEQELDKLRREYEAQTNNRGLEERSVPQSASGTDSKAESGDMQHLSQEHT